MNETWKKIVQDIVKFAIGAILGGLGIAVSGCAFIPVFK